MTTKRIRDIEIENTDGETRVFVYRKRPRECLVVSASRYTISYKIYRPKWRRLYCITDMIEELIKAGADVIVAADENTLSVKVSR